MLQNNVLLKWQSKETLVEENQMWIKLENRATFKHEQMERKTVKKATKMDIGTEVNNI